MADIFKMVPDRYTSPAVDWVYLKIFVKVFFSFDDSNIGVL